MVGMLDNVAIKPQDISLFGISHIEIKNRPSIADNIENWKVFDDDKDILNFLLNKDKYHGQELD